jgi:hypothetical protein
MGLGVCAWTVQSVPQEDWLSCSFEVVIYGFGSWRPGEISRNRQNGEKFWMDARWEVLCGEIGMTKSLSDDNNRGSHTVDLNSNFLHPHVCDVYGHVGDSVSFVISRCRAFE